MRYLNNKSLTIGVAGTRRGAGASWVSLMLSSYLSDIKLQKTSLYELSGHDDFYSIYSRMKVPTYDNTFRLMDIEVFPNADRFDTVNAKNRDIDVSVFDLGLVEDNLDELYRCDIKILVSSLAPWYLHPKDYVDEYITEVEKFDSWRMFVNFSQDKMKKYVGRLPMKFGFLPIENDPLRLSQSSIKFIRNMNI